MKGKIYISGKITGIEHEAAVLFDRAEMLLRSRGMHPVNPMKLPHDHSKGWHDYMREDIVALCTCDAIYMLRNWTDSPGAKLEHTIARRLGMLIEYEPVEITDLLRTR